MTIVVRKSTQIELSLWKRIHVDFLLLSFLLGSWAPSWGLRRTWLRRGLWTSRPTNQERVSTQGWYTWDSDIAFLLLGCLVVTFYPSCSVSRWCLREWPHNCICYMHNAVNFTTDTTKHKSSSVHARGGCDKEKDEWRQIDCFHQTTCCSFNLPCRQNNLSWKSWSRGGWHQGLFSLIRWTFLTCFFSTVSTYAS